jgi:hypothetical protein
MNGQLFREATSCELWLQFDFSQSAGSYSQLSGGASLSFARGGDRPPDFHAR